MKVRMLGRSVAAPALSFFTQFFNRAWWMCPGGPAWLPPQGSNVPSRKSAEASVLQGACDSALKTNRCFSRGSASLLPPEHICRLQAFISCWCLISSPCMAWKCVSLTHNTLATAEVSADYLGRAEGLAKLGIVSIDHINRCQEAL